MSTIRVDNIQSTTGTSGIQVDDGGLTVSELNNGPLAGMRNYIINPQFAINQRIGETYPANTAGYTRDRWHRYNACSSVTYAPLTTFHPVGISYGIRLNADGPQQYIAQPIEWDGTGEPTYGLRNGSVITVSFYAIASVAANFTVRLGTANNMNVAPSNQQTETVTIGTSLERYSVTFTISHGDVSTDTFTALAIFSNSAPVGTVDISGVQLELGSVATPLEYRPIATEQALCDRYFQRYGLSSSYSGYADVGGRQAAVATFIFRQKMRTTPTRSGGQANGINVVINSVNITDKVMNIEGVSLTSGFVYYTYDIVDLDAEL